MYNVERKFSNFIGYFYAVFATFCLSTISVGSKALRHISAAESVIYRFTIVYLITYYVVKNSKGSASFKTKPKNINILL